MDFKPNGTWTPYARPTVTIIGSAAKPHNEVWILASWDPFAKKYVADSNGSLRLMGVTDHIEEAPPRYRGPLPSFEALAYIRKSEREHQEWVERRAAMIED